MIFYPRYIGDFARKTAHLSLAERGALSALLDYQYSTESGLPDNMPALCRIAGAQGVVEIQAVESVVAEFFPRDESGHRSNPRAVLEIERAREKSEKVARGGKARANKLPAEERSRIAREAAAARWNAIG